MENQFYKKNEKGNGKRLQDKGNEVSPIFFIAFVRLLEHVCANTCVCDNDSNLNLVWTYKMD